MPTITVLEKLYGLTSPATLEKLYSSLVEGLDVQLRFVGTTDHGWIQLDVSGDDQTVALNLLDSKVGLAPVSLDGLETFSVMKGKVTFSRSNNELCVDLGIDCLEPCDVVVSEKLLQAQLTDGKPVSLQSLVDLFCLYENMPLEVKITETPHGEAKHVEAALSEEQVLLFKNWVGSRFDRLIVLCSLFSDVEQAVKLSRHFRDIIKVESLGALEQVILCKLGTDAVGLIPKLGRYLKSAVLVPFSPKKIIKAVGNEPFDW
jgi:hypothetical protein